MAKVVLSIVFWLLSAVNAVGSFFAVFVFMGMATNANGFLSGSTDLATFALVVLLPVCLFLSLFLYRRVSARLVGTTVAAVPVLVVALLRAIGAL